MLNDLFILKKIKEGDVKAFEAVFRLYYPSLCLYAASITGQTEAAEEIVEELFFQLWKERDRLELFRSVRSYLYKAVRNQSLQYCEHLEVKNRYRDAVLSGSLPDGSPADPQEEFEYKELQSLVNRTLMRLPERRSQIFRMHRNEGKKYTEIALLLSLSIKTVEAEMTKALHILRKEIENYIRTT